MRVVWSLAALLPLLLSAAAESFEVATSSSLPSPITFGGKRYRCKCYPGDSCYPKEQQWRTLNNTVNGNLRAAAPPGAVCHNKFDGKPSYDAAACQEVQTALNTANEQWITDHPVASMWPFWTNETCTAFPSSPDDSCTLGLIGNYVILAKTRQHIKAGVDFARVNNLRLIIRNTGHDFMGRSTGFGALYINTHSFKEYTFTKKYTGPSKPKWTGGAVTVGAGIQVKELYRLASQQRPPVTVVAGECPTVGVVGGYIQGGGHGPLATLYGMGADQVLSFDVLLQNGNIVTANSDKNPDLYWALKGGGPSTFGVVLAATIKTFPEVPTAALSLNINFTHTTNETLFYKGVSAYHDLSNLWVKNNMFGYFELSHLRFHAHPLVAPNMNAAQLRAVAKPLFDKLAAEGVPHDIYIKEFPTFWEMYDDMFEPELPGPAMTGGWMFTEKTIAKNPKAVVDAYQSMTPDPNIFLIGHVVAPGMNNPKPNNPTHPTWRKTSVFTIISYTVPGNATWTDKQAAQKHVTHTLGKAFRDAAPDGAAYVNEGDLEEPNWQDAYWGSNYPRLKQLKQRYDPDGLLYARATPGTENWEVIDFGSKLCKRI